MDNHRYASEFRTARSTVLGEEQFKDLVRSGVSVKLQPGQRHRLNKVETMCMTFCLLSNSTSERLSS